MKRDEFRFFHPLRVRWAEVDMQKIVFNAHYLMYFDTAVADYWRALAMPYEEAMHLLQGDLYATQARQITDTVAAKAPYEKAILAYQTGITGTIGSSSLSSLRINLASAYVGAGRPQDAINIYQDMLASNDTSVSQWQIYLALSQLNVQIGNINQARINGQLALQNVPANDAADLKTVQDWVSKLP